MGKVVDRRPAHIHAHVRGIERRERALLARQRIVELELHRTRSHPRCFVSTRHARPKRNGRWRPRWPGVRKSRARRKDSRSKLGALANNVPADAAEIVEAGHGGGAWASAPEASRAPPAAMSPNPLRAEGVFGGRKIAGECGFHVLVKDRQSPLSPALTA